MRLDQVLEHAAATYGTCLSSPEGQAADSDRALEKMEEIAAAAVPATTHELLDLAARSNELVERASGSNLSRLSAALCPPDRALPENLRQAPAAR